MTDPVLYAVLAALVAGAPLRADVTLGLVLAAAALGGIHA